MNYEGTPMKAFVVFLAVALFTISLPQSTANSASCSVPPFIRAGTKPNVLIILDNSNSMDEDFYGEAVGSYSPDSKSVVAKNALKGIIDQYQEEMRVGLMTYRLPSGVSAYNLQNSPYFASYGPRSPDVRMRSVSPRRSRHVVNTARLRSRHVLHTARATRRNRPTARAVVRQGMVRSMQLILTKL